MPTPALFERRDPPQLPSLFLLSGATPGALVARIEQLQQRVHEGVESLAASQARDAAAQWRLAIVAETPDELTAALEKARARLSVDPPPRWRDGRSLYLGSGAIDGGVAVLFPGQGSQFPGMTRDLCASIPGFRRWFDALDRAYVAGGAPPPSALAFPADGAAADPRLFALETGAQLGLAASLALYEMLLSMGIGADVFAGHSNGEHAALIAAGVLAFSDLDAFSRMASGVALEAEHLPAPARPERVVAVTGLGAPAVAPLIDGRDGVFIGVDNCPTQCLIAGLEAAVDEAASRIAARGGIPSRLPFARAHHTPLFADWSRLLGAHYTSVDVRRLDAPSPVFSCLHARRYATAPDDVRAWLTAQWSGRVRFRETIDAMYAEGIRTFVEAGPDNRLTAFVHDTLRGRPHRAVSASWSMRGGLAQLSHCAAELFAAGLPVRAAAAGALSPAAIVQREFQLTMDLAAESMARVGARVAAMTGAGATEGRDHPLLGRVRIDNGRLRADRVWEAGRHAFLRHHSLARFDTHPRGLAVMPFTMMMALAAEAAAALTGAPVTALRDMRAASWLALDRGAMTLHVEARQEASGVRVTLSDGGVTAFEAVADCGGPAADVPPAVSFAGTMTGAHIAGAWSAEALYREYLFHGPQYAAIARITRVRGATIEAELMPPDASFDGLDPLLDFRLLDCAGQLAAAWRLERTGEKAGAFPFSAARLRIANGRFRPAARVTCRGSVRENALGILESSFDFLDERGHVLASLERFEQRVVTFPDAVWARLFAPDGGRRPHLDEARTFLQQPGSIWARALAHVAFEDGPLDRWYALPDAGARLDALIRA